jgi:hypothetical protein
MRSGFTKGWKKLRILKTNKPRADGRPEEKDCGRVAGWLGKENSRKSCLVGGFFYF